MKVLVIEDENVAARRLMKLLRDFNFDVIEHCVSLSEVRNYLKINDEPDLYFMDIHLSDGLIFEIFDELTIQSPIIFTTAYDQYAIKAFKRKSVDYL
jgi:DNA-binding LytR/AlgR family response regulator